MKVCFLRFTEVTYFDSVLSYLDVMKYKDYLLQRFHCLSKSKIFYLLFLSFFSFPFGIGL